MTTYNRLGMAKNKIEKTNAARLLDRAGIAYELIPYTVDETNLAAAHVAEELGEDIATVFKTLVLCGDKTGYLVCVVPGDHRVPPGPPPCLWLPRGWTLASAGFSCLSRPSPITSILC